MEVPEEITIAGDAAHIIHEAQAVSLDADGLFLLVYLGGLLGQRTVFHLCDANLPVIVVLRFFYDREVESLTIRQGIIQREWSQKGQVVQAKSLQKFGGALSKKILRNTSARVAFWGEKRLEMALF